MIFVSSWVGKFVYTLHTQVWDAQIVAQEW
jgi:hypothetical protein